MVAAVSTCGCVHKGARPNSTQPFAFKGRAQTGVPACSVLRLRFRPHVGITRLSSADI